MMTICEDNDFPCQNPDYSAFDVISRQDLSRAICCDTLINTSQFCMMIPVDKNFAIGDLDHKLYLKTLKGQSGLYQLWIDHDYCSDHDTYAMLCVYVGKGPPDDRIASHIKLKWPSGIQLYVTFNAMTNRLAKYYEQLFLDCYDFALNKAENSGTAKLYGVWESVQHDVGTHLTEVSSKSTIQGFSDW